MVVEGVFLQHLSVLLPHEPTSSYWDSKLCEGTHAQLSWSQPMSMIPAPSIKKDNSPLDDQGSFRVLGFFGI